MTGTEYHHKRNAPAPSPMAALDLVGASLQGVVALMVLFGAVVWWFGKSYKPTKTALRLPLFLYLNLKSCCFINQHREKPN